MANMNYRQEESISVSSPYFLHPGENPSLVLVSTLLDGGNYHKWYRSMRMALLSKNKFKFVDGSISVRNRDDVSFEIWERCNTMVMSWLYRAVTSTIDESISCLDSAYEIWNDLRDRFSQGDNYRIGDLQEEIYTFQQSNLSITEYYTHLKTLWDELQIYLFVRDNQSSDQSIKFLRGLNENFAHVRSQILMNEVLPPINKVFSLLIQHERQLNNPGRQANSEASIFAAKSSFQNQYETESSYSDGNQLIGYESNINYVRGRGTPVYRGRGTYRPPFNSGFQANKLKMCSYCGYSGHTVEICYRKHGYPPGFQPKYKSDNY
ncbi:uncharacterized protein LOC126672815 [Mercurialis annua]|uniref:uncharacterized protein LOC126672815 n=1 Tax=Mercurialis annua TaxID=3986 RepID=UPI002160E53C|nr:uncharacterized protein LOC126672815 [Mercurialis annua]